jgi:hypothetical protein
MQEPGPSRDFVRLRQLLRYSTKCRTLRDHSNRNATESEPSGNLGKDVLVLAIADNQYPLARTFAHHEFESSVPGSMVMNEVVPSSFLRDATVLFALAEIECSHSVLGEHSQVTELLAGITLCQNSHQRGRRRHYKAFAVFRQSCFVG